MSSHADSSTAGPPLKVLIIRAGALGDTLMLMPAITRLRSGAGIVLAGRAPGIEFLNAHVDQCIDLERSGWHRLFTEDFAGDRKPRMPDADYVVAFLNDPEGVIGHNLKRIYPARPVHIFPPFPPEKEKIHMALYMIRCIVKAGLPMGSGQPKEESLMRPFFYKTGPPGDRALIVLHPGSGSVKKNYSPGFWLRLIGSLRDTCGDRAVKTALLLGPAEEGLLPFFQGALKQTDIEILFCPEKENLISILVQAGLFIGHDSGITHLAAMLGTVVIALFKDSCVSLWRPLGPQVHVMEKENSESEFIREIVEKGREVLSMQRKGDGT